MFFQNANDEAVHVDGSRDILLVAQTVHERDGCIEAYCVLWVQFSWHLQLFIMIHDFGDQRFEFLAGTLIVSLEPNGLDTVFVQGVGLSECGGDEGGRGGVAAFGALPLDVLRVLGLVGQAAAQVFERRGRDDVDVVAAVFAHNALQVPVDGGMHGGRAALALAPKVLGAQQIVSALVPRSVQINVAHRQLFVALHRPDRSERQLSAHETDKRAVRVARVVEEHGSDREKSKSHVRVP